MKALIVSDTHRDFAKLKTVMEKNTDADLIVHLGDGENEFKDIKTLYPDLNYVFVKGETDYNDLQVMHIAELGGYKILCTHGDQFNVHEGLDELINEAKILNCRIVLYGHTHLYRSELIDGIYIMNPGSLHSPRGNRPPSYGIINIDDKSNITLNIVALK